MFPECCFVLLSLLSFLRCLNPAQADSSFGGTKGAQFVMNGKPFYINGFNAYWMMYMASDPSRQAKVTSAFQQASQYKMNVARTWGFSDGGDRALQTSPGSYNENMFKGLDFVISEAKKYGVYLILSLVNNYKDFGGRKQYVQWARERGQSVGSDDDFYSNVVVKGFYKNHVKITKRLTRAADFFKSNDEGKSSSNDRLCIEILEQAERRDPVLGEASLSLAIAGDDLRMKLLYLENRVGLARYLFPMEAKVVLGISQLDETPAFPIACLSRNDPAGSRTTTVDLNVKEEHLARLRALCQSVELGKRFFPRCSEVLNKIMDGDDMSQLMYTGDDTPEVRLTKRKRYTEIQEVLSKAFDEDKQDIDRSAMSSSSSSTSVRAVRPKLTVID